MWLKLETTNCIGSQYRHVYISSDTATIDNSALSQIVKGGIGTG